MYNKIEFNSIDTNSKKLSDHLKISIGNILSTRKGSLPGRLSFGSNLEGLLFDLIDVAPSIIKDEIKKSLSIWEPRIIVNDIIIKEQPEYNRIFIDIHFIYRDESSNIKEDNLEYIKNF